MTDVSFVISTIFSSKIYSSVGGGKGWRIEIGNPPPPPSTLTLHMFDEAKHRLHLSTLSSFYPHILPMTTLLNQTVRKSSSFPFAVPSEQSWDLFFICCRLSGFPPPSSLSLHPSVQPLTFSQPPPSSKTNKNPLIRIPLRGEKGEQISSHPDTDYPGKSIPRCVSSIHFFYRESPLISPVTDIITTSISW